MDKKTCKIVQDLLPNYVESLTNEETNEFVEKHLKECRECNEINDNMKKDFYKKESEETKDINFLKKHRKKLNILRNCILIIIIGIICIVGFNIGRKMYILYDLSVKGLAEQERRQVVIKNGQENPDMSNEYITHEVLIRGLYFYTEAYKKDGNYLAISYNDIYKEEKDIIYKKDGEEFMLTSDGKMHIEKIGIDVKPYNYASYSFWDALAIAININSMQLQTADIYGHECYIIYHNGIRDYVEKDTGIVIQRYGLNREERFTYKSGVVTDSDLERPDTTGYTVVGK